MPRYLKTGTAGCRQALPVWLALLVAILVAIVAALSLPGRAQARPVAQQNPATAAQDAAAAKSSTARKTGKKRYRPEYVPKVRGTSYDVTLVTMAQLDEALRDGLYLHDRALAEELQGLVLTERMSSARLAAWKARIRGKHSRLALQALADGSVFLNLPATEIAGRMKPDLVEQKEMVRRAVERLNFDAQHPPNLIARNRIIRFDDTWEGWTDDGYRWFSGQPWREISDTKESVLYHAGVETEIGGRMRSRDGEMDGIGLRVPGIFGPLLQMVVVDVAHGSMTWDHWEQSAQGAVAVFRYSVPQKLSHYKVIYDSIQGKHANTVLSENTAYHGELTLDPSNGAILRLTLMADMPPTSLVLKSNLMVEYVLVTLKGRGYICPTRSVAISTGRMVPEGKQEKQDSFGPEETVMSDSEFEPCRLAD